MSRRAHEHFCSMCYPQKTNGQARGWWRCTAKPCIRPEKSICRKHERALRRLNHDLREFRPRPAWGE